MRLSYNEKQHYDALDRFTHRAELLLRSDFDLGCLGARWCPIKNLGASGAAGKFRLSKLYCSERRVGDRATENVSI